LDRLEANQEMMVSANLAIRKYAKAGLEAQKMALMDLGFDEGNALDLLNPSHFGSKGYARFSLSNNGATIRTLKARIESLTKIKDKPDTERVGTLATMSDCPADNRIRLLFPDKPSEEVRKVLKSHGFRWTPSLGVWQAYRKQYTYDLAVKLAGV
jgi:hypothetical protein